MVNVAAKLGDMLIPTIYRNDGSITLALTVGTEVAAIIEFTSCDEEKTK